MAMTLLEASKLNPAEVVRNGVIEMFARTSPLLAAIPFIDVPGGVYEYAQEGELPGVGFRAINAAFDESVGVINPQAEFLRLAGGDLDVDRALVRRHGMAVRTRHEMMKVKAMALMLGRKLLKGDSVSDPREFDGLQNRITGSQLIAAGSTNGGDPLSLLKLDEAIHAVDFPTHLIMSLAMVRRLTQAARDSTVGGFITYSQDAFGQQVTRYNNLPILTPEQDNEGKRVLAFDEVGPGGSNATATSIYVVSFREDMLVGLQNGIMDVRDLGEIDAKPVYRSRVDWDVGLAALHGRCAARLWGISNAAVTA